MKFSDTALLLVAFVWGLTFVMIKESLTFISPFKFLSYRFLLSFLFLTVISVKKLKTMNYDIIRYGIFIGIALFSGYGFQTVGLQYTTPANAGFITGLSVVIVPFLAVVFLKKKLHIYSFAGVVCAAAGLFFLSFERMEMNYGDFLILLCAFSFAMHLILVGKYAPSHDPVLLTLVQIGTVAVLSLLSCLFSVEQETVNAVVVQALIITSLFATVLAFLVQNMAQRHTPPTRTAVIFAMEPVFAAVCSYLLIQEVYTVRKIVGCLFILSGMLIAELKK